MPSPTASAPRSPCEFISDVATHLVLPALTIVLVSIGGWMLGMRNTMIATTAEDYITMAEAKGLRPARIMFQYAARNAMLPSVTVVRHVPWLRRRRRAAHRGRVRLPGHRLPAPDRRPGAGLPADARHLPDHYRRRAGANFLVDIIYVRLDPRVRVAETRCPHVTYRLDTRHNHRGRQPHRSDT